MASELPDTDTTARRVITLCGVQGCCPTLEVGDQVVLRDDFGGSVTLNAEQWAELVGLARDGSLSL